MVASQARVREQIQRWRDELINLARSNRLLFYRATKSSSLAIVDPPPDRLMSRLLQPGKGGWTFHFPPEDPEVEAEDPPQPSEILTDRDDPRQIELALRNLERRATQEFMDKGLSVLYLGIGMLEWVDPERRESAKSPLLMVPVTLSRENPRSPYRLMRSDDDAVLNQALVVQLQRLGVELPDSIDETDEEQPQQVLDRIRASVARQAGWTVTDEVVLSVFSFHKEVMYRDLLENEELVAASDFVYGLALGADAREIDYTFVPIPEDELDEVAPAEDLSAILDTDSTQRQCISSAAAGRSFVMDGPPGTGKSQTISNMIAELIRSGKTVLFVSEKAAALEVVHSRLAAAGLDDYLLELHSHKATRKDVAASLGKALTTRPVSGRAMSRGDSQRLKEVRAALSAYAAAMNEVREPLGRSLHDVLGRCGQLTTVPQAPVLAAAAGISDSELSRALAAAGQLARSWGPVERGPDFLWRGCNESRFDARTRQQIGDELRSLREGLDRVSNEASEVADILQLTTTTSIVEARRLVALLELLDARPLDIPAEWLTRESLGTVRERLSEVREIADVHAGARAELERFAPEAARALAGELARAGDDGGRFIDSTAPWALPPADATAPQLRRFETLVSTARERLTAIAADARSLGTSLALGWSRGTIGDASTLASLGRLGGEVHRPERVWLNPTTLSEIEVELPQVTEVCLRFREQREALTPTYAPAVLDLDLRPLLDRFEHEHRGLGRLQSTYRADKKVLRSVSSDGRWHKALIERLPDAVEWLATREALAALDEAIGETIGSHYFMREETDLDALNEAVGNARTALDLLGGSAPPLALEEHLARGSVMDEQALEVASQLDRACNEWIADWRGVVDEAALAQMLSEPIDAATDAFGAIEMAAHDLTEGVLAVESVVGGPTGFASSREVLHQRRTVVDAESDMDAARAADQDLLGPLYRGLETSWPALEEAVQWADRLREHLDAPIERATAGALLDENPDATALVGSLTGFEKAMDRVAARFSDERGPEVTNDVEASDADATILVDDLLASVGDIDEWVSFRAALDELAGSGLEP
jgi:hypothetical protein